MAVSSYTKVLRDLSLVSLLALPAISSATDLSGVILDDRSQPVAGASVTVARSSVDGPLPGAEAHSTTTAADGTYVVKGLGAGPYMVCASIDGRDLLDPCEWGTPAVVRLAGGTGTASTSTQLQLGGLVNIRVDDTAQLLFTTPVLGTANPFISMGVWSPDGHFHPARHFSSDSTGHGLGLAVAPNVALAFAVSAQNVSVADASTNSVVSPSQRVSVNLAPGATLQLHYVVSASSGSTTTP